MGTVPPSPIFHTNYLGKVRPGKKIGQYMLLGWAGEEGCFGGVVLVFCFCVCFLFVKSYVYCSFVICGIPKSNSGIRIRKM